MVIIETSVFTRQVQELLSDEEYRELQTALVNRPNAGSVIVGSGGLRKLRWATKGRKTWRFARHLLLGRLARAIVDVAHLQQE